jgi:hypothetical protein
MTVYASSICVTERSTVVSYTEQLQHIVGEYRNAGQPWPATSHEIASWAIDHDPWATATWRSD